MLGVRGALGVPRRAVTLANAIGTGSQTTSRCTRTCPNDPFYLGEEPILKNVPTYVLRRKDDLKYVLAHLASWW